MTPLEWILIGVIVVLVGIIIAIVMIVNSSLPDIEKIAKEIKR